MVFGVLLLLAFIFGYPVLASALASRGMKRRIDALELDVARLQRGLELAEAQPGNAGRDAAAPRTASSTAEPSPEQPASGPRPAAAAPAPSAPASAPEPQPEPQPQLYPQPQPQHVEAPPPPPTPAPPPVWLTAVRNWLFTGNLVAKLGLLILFIGVSFLLKYASERVSTPIELRLAGIALADIGLLAWAWRMRLSRRNLSLPIQGAAIGILMLVTFGAFRLYHLIPSGLAFGLLFVLTAFVCLLAVKQDAVWLAVFGIVGGFLSPIMTSTGAGSHVALFSYYALLNAGILAIALKRTWRLLNLLGFAFTFVIGTAWGVLRYSADEHYLSAQLFLVLFFVFYVAIAVVYAMRRVHEDTVYVDATIVFGTALAAFGLQLGLIKRVEFGNAFSALGFGVFYISLAMALWSRRSGKLKLLVESFLALGVVFGTLAIPFALDGRWTSAAWALEGAGVAWVALRQRQRLAFLFGMLVQAGAWISFIGTISGLAPQAARESNLWLGFLILATSAFFMAATLRSHEDGERLAFPHAADWFLGFAGAWFMAGAWTEILLRQHGTAQANMLVASGLATALILSAIGFKMKWASARTLSLAAQLIAGAALFVIVMSRWGWTVPGKTWFEKPLAGALMIFAAAIITSWNMWRMPSNPGMHASSQLMLAYAAAWLFGPILNAVSGTLMVTLAPQAMAQSMLQTWPGMYAACVAASAVLVALSARRLGWDTLCWLSSGAWIVLGLMTLLNLAYLYLAGTMPLAPAWTGFAAVWLVGEFLLRWWAANGWQLPDRPLRLVHLVRTAGPWVMLWKVGEIMISARMMKSGWSVSPGWANFIPAWAMMFVILWLIGRSDQQRWPVAPIAAWYRHVLLPAATAWSLLLALVWNFAGDGAMAPLPYIPVLNPLDLTTGFSLMLAMSCYRMLDADAGTWSKGRAALVARMPMAAAIAAYGWFNLMLLRSASHMLDIPYRAGDLYASQFVQAMLSLVWSVTALLLMWRAVRKAARPQWMVGAGLLALVVAKLFLVDLAGVGSVARIVSFVGVGLLMVLIGYLAPYPGAVEPTLVKVGA